MPSHALNGADPRPLAGLTGHTSGGLSARPAHRVIWPPTAGLSPRLVQHRSPSQWVGLSAGIADPPAPPNAAPVVFGRVGIDATPPRSG